MGLDKNSRLLMWKVYNNKVDKLLGNNLKNNKFKY